MAHFLVHKETANINKHVSKKNKTKNTFALQTVTEDVTAMVVWLLYILTMTGYSSVRERKTDTVQAERDAVSPDDSRGAVLLLLVALLHSNDCP